MEHTHLSAVAFTYAWWLTGDEEQAERALRTAAERIPPEAWRTADELGTVLEAVRDIAAPNRTMCPASELALLHDGHGLPLDRAAELSRIAADDARTELAHGRLEALVETVREPFEHPERLGGLAVGNPPDVAHARTCPSCADARELLRKGKEELAALPEVPPPVGLHETLEQIARAPASSREAEARRIIDLTGVEGEPLELDDTAPTSTDPADRKIGGTVLAVLAVLIGLVILGIAVLTGDPGRGAEPAGAPPADTVARPPAFEPAEDQAPAPGPDPGVEPEQDAPAPDVDPSPDAPEADSAPDEVEGLLGGPVVEGFALTDARLVPRGDDPTVVAPRDPVRVAVDYSGAEAVSLRAVLDLADGTSSDLQVVLTAPRSSHVFVWRAPPEGWPQGPHEVRLVAEGALVGVVDVPTG